MSEAQPSPDETQPAPEEAVSSESLFEDEPKVKGRSPIERAIVWGLIVILLAVVGIEYYARASYDSTLNGLEDAIEATADNDIGLPLSEARKSISGLYSESEMAEISYLEREVEYKWFSLFKDYQMLLRVEASGDDPSVTRFVTPNADGGFDERAANTGKPMQIPDDAPDMSTMGIPSGPGGGGSPGMGPGAGGGGNPFAGGGGDRNRRRRPLNSMIALIQNDAVRKEIGLTDDQIEKLVDVAAKARPNFQELLDDEQFKRLRQITLQKLGAVALGREDIADELGLSDAQKDAIKELLGERQSATRELGRGASPEEREAATTPFDTKLLETLEDAQKEAFDGLMGEFFEVPEGDSASGRPERPSAE